MLLLLFQRRPKTQINSIDDKWIKLWQNKYGVSFKKPKKRHSIKREDFSIICKTYRQFADISFKTGMPLHRNESLQEKTVAIKGGDIYQEPKTFRGSV